MTQLHHLNERVDSEHKQELTPGSIHLKASAAATQAVEGSSSEDERLVVRSLASVANVSKCPWAVTPNNPQYHWGFVHA